MMLRSGVEGVGPTVTRRDHDDVTKKTPKSVEMAMMVMILS